MNEREPDLGAFRHVPFMGVIFDVNPGKLRPGDSRYGQWMRFSFGPPLDNMRLGLGRLERMLGR